MSALAFGWLRIPPASPHHDCDPVFCKIYKSTILNPHKPSDPTPNELTPHRRHSVGFGWKLRLLWTDQPIDIGSHSQLFVDQWLVAELTEKAGQNFSAPRLTGVHFFEASSLRVNNEALGLTCVSDKCDKRQSGGEVINSQYSL